MRSPKIIASVGTKVRGMGVEILISCVSIMTKGIARTASQKFVWITGNVMGEFLSSLRVFS